MPIDLDELFGTMGRDADALPLAPAAQARRRGRRRNRTRAALSAGAAVCLIATGVGVAMRHDPNPDWPVQGLSPVGPPIEYGATTDSTWAAITSTRVYTAWQPSGGSTRVTAADLRTGALAWRARNVGESTDRLGVVEALDEAVLVILHRPEGVTPDRLLSVLDPADGRQRWQLPYNDGDDLVLHGAALVHTWASTGRTDAFNWADGTTRWTLPASADRPVRTLGTRLPGDYAGGGDSLRPAAFTDSRLVQVTAAGKVQVRDINTGAVIRTVTTARADPAYPFVSYDGWLYNGERAGGGGFQIRATDLRTAQGGSKVVLREGAGHWPADVQPCGAQRLCVLGTGNDRRTSLTAVDAATGKRLWQVAGPNDASGLTARHGRLLVSGAPEVVLYDQADGRVAIRLPPNSSVDWLDAETLLVLPGNGGGPVAEVTIAGGRWSPLGELPASTGPCTWTTERLACPGNTSLRIWSLTG